MENCKDPRVARSHWCSAERYRVVPETELVAHLHVAGWCTSANNSFADCRAEIGALLNDAVGLGLCTRQSGGVRYFDPVETLNFFKWAGLASISPVWANALVPTTRTLVAEALALPATTGFEVDFARRFNMARVGRKSQIRLRIPLPLNYRDQSLVTAEHCHSNVTALRVVEGESWLEGKIESGFGKQVTLRSRFTLRPCSEPIKDLRPLGNAYLAYNEGIIRITPRLGHLAGELTGGIKDPHEIASRLFSFLLDDLILGAVHYDLLATSTSAQEWVLDNGWFDCFLGSALLVALCRVAGIPARILSGYFLFPQSPTVHSWAEIWLPDIGWQAFDLMVWDASMGGRDIAWRDCFAARIDHRLVSACLPDKSPPMPGVPIPEAWGVVVNQEEGVTASHLRCAHSGEVVYSDELSVTHFDAMLVRPSLHRAMV